MEEKEYALIPIGTEVSAKYRGAFCEAKIGKYNKCVKCRVVFDGEQGSSVVLDDNIRGNLKVGEKVEARLSPSKPYKRATLLKIVDHTMYTVVFNDGDQRELKRTQLCIKGDKHFTESESLDSMPLVHPEEFGSPVVNRDKRDRDDSWVGQLVCIETELKPGGQAALCPCLVVVADAQGRRAKKDQLVVRSFMDGKYMTVLRKEAKSFKINDSQISSQDNNSTSSVSHSSEEGTTAKSRQKTNNADDGGKQPSQSKALAKAYERASAYWENDVLPDGWSRAQLLDACDDEPPTKRTNRMGSDDGEDDESSSSLSSFESSDEEGQPSEERDRFVAQLYRFMDERGTPLNKAPSLANKDLDLYRLYSIVHHCGGFNRVNRRDKWLSIYKRMHIPHSATARSQIIRAYKKYLQPFEEFYRKLGSTMGTVDVWGRTRHASSRAFISTREKSQSRSESRLNSSSNSVTTLVPNNAASSSNNNNSSSNNNNTNNNNNTAANTAVTSTSSASLAKQTPSTQPSSSKSPLQTGGDTTSSSTKQQQAPTATPVANAAVASSLLSSRRSSAMGESDSGVSEKTGGTPAVSKQHVQSATNRRSRRESQSKDTADPEHQSSSAQRNRRSAAGQGAPSARGGRGGSRSHSHRNSTAGDDNFEDGVESSDNDRDTVTNNDDNVSTQSGEDSSSTEFGTMLPPTVAAAAGLSANASAPLPLETCVKVKCGRGSVTATYEGKITAMKRESDGEYRYHVHYRGWNSRYDEWIVAGRISQIIRIGDESSAETQQAQQQQQQQPNSASNMNSSRASSVPNSVVSASESDIAVLNDEQQRHLQASDNTVKQPPVGEESPDKDAVSNSSGPAASPENNINADTNSSVKASLVGSQSSARKRKVEDKQGGPVEKNGPETKMVNNNNNGGKDKDSSSESCVEKQSKNWTSNITTRSTRGKPGEDSSAPQTASNNGARGHGHRRGVIRTHGKGSVVISKEDLAADITDVSNDKIIKPAPSVPPAFSNIHSAAAAIAASKSPSKVAAEQRRLTRPNKFNFRFEDIEKCATRDDRISFIMGKITEIRSIYSDLKQKVADIDKKRRLYRSYISSTKNSNMTSTMSASITVKQQVHSDSGAVATLTQTMTVTSETATLASDKDVFSSAKARP